MTVRFTNTLEEITRIQRSPPPCVSIPLTHGTMITGAWVNQPIHDYVAPMEDHIIAATLRGDGSSAMRSGAKEIMTRSVTGGVTIAPRGHSGHFDCNGRPVTANVFLTRSRLQQCADQLDGGRVPELLPRLNFEDSKLFAVISLIRAEAERPGDFERLYLEHLIDLLCIQLIRDHSAFPLHGREPRCGLTAWQVKRVTTYMHDHLDQDVELEHLARLLDLSRFHLCKAFRRATGFTPHQWLVRLRMDRARHLLSQSHSNITDVAMAVGYHTPSSFAQAFRATVGRTPSEFRRNSRL